MLKRSGVLVVFMALFVGLAAPASAHHRFRHGSSTTTTIRAPTTTTAKAPTTTTTPPPSGSGTKPAGAVCGDASILNGPTTAPAGAVVVPPGENLYNANQANPAGTTFYLLAGTHTLVANMFGQVIPKDGNSYIGAPGAIFDGQGINRYAFTQKAANVTVKHLTVTGFVAPGDEGVVNHDYATGWVIERNTIAKNNGAGVMLGDDNRMTYNCLADNGQYGFQGFGKNLTIDRNEVARNNTYDWETKTGGCGCSGGSKFWDAGPGTVTNNWVHDNDNVGLWWDNNNREFLVEGNTIEGNRGHGIEYETSYNVVIRNNVIRRNAIPQGQSFQSRNDPFPIGSIYLSEAGGDARLGAYPTVEVSNNRFEENWGGIVAWENADRFGHDNSANTSKGFTTLAIDPTGTWQSSEMWKCGDPSTGGLINNGPYKTDCRWRTVNLNITGNTFAAADKAAIGCTTHLCNQHGLFSNYGTTPSWSPFLGRTVQDAITFKQNNRWRSNTYIGDWRFVAYEATGPTLSLDQWRAAPYNQDAGSTLNGATTPTPTTTVPSTTSTTTFSSTPVTESIWSDSQAVEEVSNGTEWTLGSRFTVSVAGKVTALRLYETPNMTGTIGLKLWRATGPTTAVELTSTTYDASSPGTGWRNVSLGTSVAVVPTERYAVTYHAPGTSAVGFTWGLLTTAKGSGSVKGSANGDPVGYGNGVYQQEAGTHGFPVNSAEGHAYFADVVFVRN